MRVSNDSLNSYGFRTLTSGCDDSLYQQNPILLFQHTRPWRGSKDEVLPIGILTDIKIEGNEISALPAFDTDDKFAMKVAKKWEKGVYNMCSVGFDPVATTEEPDKLLPGQKYATVEKWLWLETSIVDIGANRDSLALHRDGQRIELSSEGDIPTELISKLDNTNKPENMKSIALALGLKEDATEAEILTALNAQKSALADAQTKLADIDAAKKTAEVNALVDKALADKKIVDAEKEHYLKLANADFDSTKALLDSKEPFKPVGEQLGDHKPDTEDLAKLSWDEIYRSGKLPQLKEDKELYKLKFKEKFGADPNA